jgi:hypothetical protein
VVRCRKCRRCGKITYGSAGAASTAVSEITARQHLASGTLRPYPCPSGGGWHIGHVPYGVKQHDIAMAAKWRDIRAADGRMY